MTPEQRMIHDGLIKVAVDQGKLLEVGFLGLVIALELDPTESRFNDMRLAYYAGAQHLFASIMAMLDPDKEPTIQDLQRMDRIYRELQAMEPELKLRGIKPEGRG